MVQQHEQSECGLACLSMIAYSMGHERSLAELRRMSEGHSSGLALDDLLRLSGQLGLVARPVRLSLVDIQQLAVPAILHWRMNHFVVLIRARRFKILIHDPATGKQWVPISDVDKSFTGVALELKPGPDFNVCRRHSEPEVFDLVRGVRNIRAYIATILVLVLAAQFLSLAPAVVTQLLIDEVILGQARHWLTAAIAGLFVVLLSAVLVDGLRRWLSLYAGVRLAVDTTCNLVSHLFRLPLDFIRDRHLGDIMSKLDSLVPLRQAITEQGIDAIANATLLVVTLGVMLFYSAELTLVTIVGLVLTFLVLTLMLPKMRQLNGRLLNERAGEKSSLLESLRAFETVKSLGISEIRSGHWQNRFIASTDTSYRLGKLDITRTSMLSVIAAIEQSAFLAVGIGGAIDRDITIGVLFAFMNMRGRCASAAMKLVDGYQAFALLRVHTGRLGDLVSGEAEQPARRGALYRPLGGKLEARGVEFGFSRDRPVIRNFDCHIPAGAHVVITGPSGCGKTTLLRLMCGQLQTDAGNILVDDLELSLWDRAGYLRQIGVVLQNERLFQGTIADNIAAFSSCPDLARIRSAAIAAEIWEDIQRLPMKTETLLGDTGTTLSGGQVQRIAIARAIFRHPKILFLDEATSHLDTDTESRVLANMSKLNITIVSIAHRPGAIARAAQVIRLGGSPAIN